MDQNTPNVGGTSPDESMSDGSAAAGTGEVKVDLNLHSSGIVLSLENVVASANLNCVLDLKEIALHEPFAEYNPKKLKGLLMLTTEPEARVLLFASGKIVVVDTKSEEMSQLAAHKCADIIQKLGYPAKLTDFHIQSLIGSYDVCFTINLKGLALSHAQFSSYNPKRFKGLIYRMAKPKIRLLVYKKGKIVVTGAKAREDMYQAFENIYPVLTEFRKQ